MSATPHETTAQAPASVQVKTLQGKDFLHFIDHHIEGTMHAAQILNREYRGALSDATRLALSLSISVRVARLFLELASGHGGFTLSLTHEDLASMLGITRETVTTVLSELKHSK
jgi:CRP/FNR family cyclic AMP-dependent transcriptional regulator